MTSVETIMAGEILLLARIVFGGILLYMAIPHFRSLEQYTALTESKEVPLPKIAVLTSGGILVVGSLLILTGIQPAVGALLVLIFLIGVTPKIHNFWEVEDPQQRQIEKFHFEKNLVIAGGALFVLAISGGTWPYVLPI